MSDKRQEYHKLEHDLPPISHGPKRKKLITLKNNLSPIAPELKNISAAINSIRLVHDSEVERLSHSNNSSEAIELLEKLMSKIDDITASTGQITKLIRK